MAKQFQRYGTTARGKRVPLGTLTRVEGGWQGWILNGRLVAVAVFIPGE